MVASVIIKPSTLMGKIQLQRIEEHTLFKFTEDMQSRMEELLDKKKSDRLTLEEISELEAIGELDRIFTHINAMLLAQK
ncbi:hypothetical protein [Coleofasciculus chthonoplastes]|uniref:hypothetical protein n=1 Tax=Coleofasciculus chthonoplastes TaxID=64178 RepID=UPI0002FAAD25|nr:hypothetical protein [Coleofasciculus chthonoplastes]